MRTISAVTETVPEPETAVFRQNHGEPKPRFFWSQMNTVSPSDICVQSQWVGSGEETEGVFIVFSVG